MEPRHLNRYMSSGDTVQETEISLRIQCISIEPSYWNRYRSFDTSVQDHRLLPCKATYLTGTTLPVSQHRLRYQRTRKSYTVMYATYHIGIHPNTWQRYVRYRLKEECSGTMTWLVSQWKANTCFENDLGFHHLRYRLSARSSVSLGG